MLSRPQVSLVEDGGVLIQLAVSRPVKARARLPPFLRSRSSDYPLILTPVARMRPGFLLGEPAGTASTYAGTERVRASRSGGMRGIGRRGAQASSGKGGSASRGLARIVNHDEHRLYVRRTSFQLVGDAEAADLAREMGSGPRACEQRFMACFTGNAGGETSNLCGKSAEKRHRHFLDIAG
jgi:hypothetical protein